MSNSAFTPVSLTLPASGTSGSGQGEINIVTNPSASTDKEKWTPTVELNFTREASGSPLDPVVPTGFSILSTGIGETVTSDAFTVPTSLRNRKLKLEFYMTQATAAFKVDVLDSTGTTRFALSTDSSNVTNLPALSGSGKFVTYFDMDGGEAIRVRFTSILATGTLKFTQVIVGPGIQPQGAVVSEPQSTTSYPTFSGLTKGTGAGESAVFERIGSSVKYRYEITLGTSGGLTGSISASAPSSFPIDTSKIVSGRVIGLARLYDDSTSNRYTGNVFLGADGTIYIEGPNGGRWSNTFPVPDTTVNDLLALDITYPVSTWAGSGTVQLAQNDVEFASNSSTSSSDDPNSFAYGPSGSLVPSITEVTNSGTLVLKDVRFQTPIQATDTLNLEFQIGGTGSWLEVGKLLDYTSLNSPGSGLRGVGFVKLDSNTIRIRFAVGGRTNAGGSYPATGGDRWRVRKSSAGAAVGFGIVQPGLSAGLVSASGVPGNTTGNAIASGYFGEVLNSTVTEYSGGTTSGATVATLSNVPPGIYLANISIGSIDASGMPTFVQVAGILTTNSTLSPASTTASYDSPGTGLVMRYDNAAGTPRIKASNSAYLSVTATSTYYIRVSTIVNSGLIGVKGYIQLIGIP